MTTEVPDMGTQEDAALIRRGYEAFIAGDMDTLMELFTEDSVWNTGGTGALSGIKRGRDAILAYFGELGSRSNGSLKVTLEDVATGDRYTIGVHSNQAERDGKSLDQRSVIVFTVSDGKVTEALELQEDTAEVADFWT
jgi:ketosteroid isomerase-like protein